MKQVIILGLAIMLVFSSFQEKNEIKLTVEIQNFNPDLLQIRDAFGQSSSIDSLRIEGGKFEINIPIDKPCIYDFFMVRIGSKFFFNLDNL